MTKSLLEVESNMILGKGAFGRCVKCRRVKGKYKGISVSVKFLEQTILCEVQPYQRSKSNAKSHSSF